VNKLFIFLFLAAFLTVSESKAAPTSSQLRESSLAALNSERYFDAQTLALIGQNLFMSEPQAWAQFTFWRSYSLLKLGDVPEAVRTIRLIQNRKNIVQSVRSKFEFFEHWIYLQSGDQNNFKTWLENSAPKDIRSKGQVYLKVREAQPVAQTEFAEMSESSQDLLLHELSALENLPRQSPLFNGLLNAVLPGAGHARLGRWQDAGLTFLLNFITIGATAEFARKEMVMPAVAAGTLASLFYVGGITSAWRLTIERNEQLRGPHLRNVESILFPELRLEF
jgi:hypothetical protein